MGFAEGMANSAKDIGADALSKIMSTAKGDAKAADSAPAGDSSGGMGAIMDSIKGMMGGGEEVAPESMGEVEGFVKGIKDETVKAEAAESAELKAAETADEVAAEEEVTPEEEPIPLPEDPDTPPAPSGDDVAVVEDEVQEEEEEVFDEADAKAMYTIDEEGLRTEPIPEEEELEPSKAAPKVEASTTAGLDEALGGSVSEVMDRENINKKGFKKKQGDTEEKYYDFASSNDPISKNPTQKEIGFGTVVRPEWLKHDAESKKKWPISVVTGKPMDISKGITEEEAEGLVLHYLKENYNKLKKKHGYAAVFDNLAYDVQAAIADLVYNVGPNAISPTKTKGFNKHIRNGDVGSAFLETFDMWLGKREDGTKGPLRGLHKRRIAVYNKMAAALGMPKVVKYEWGAGKAVVHFDKALSSGDGFTGADIGKTSRTYENAKIKGTLKEYTNFN